MTSKSRFLKNSEPGPKSNLQSVAPEDPSEEAVEELNYKEIACPDLDVLFDSGAEWTTRDRSVYQMVGSIFPALMTRMEGGPAMRTCLVLDDREEGDENQDSASLSVESRAPQFDLASVSSSSSSAASVSGDDDVTENTECGRVEENAYGRRLVAVRRLLAQNPDVSKRKLAKFLTGNLHAPLSESDRNRIEPPARDSEVSLEFNGNRYQGRLSRLCLEGVGRLEFATGAVYEGTFSNNTLCGQGRLDWPDGSYYEGGFHDNRRHGYGLFRSAASNEEVYIGSWYQGLRHGKGCQYYNLSHDDFYEGDFQCNKRTGRGLRRWRGGRSYEGEWAEDVIQGRGVMMYHNGTYSGEWLRGQMHGYGKYVWTDALNHSGDGTRKHQPHNISLQHCKSHPMEGTLPPPQCKDIDETQTVHSLDGMRSRTNSKQKEEVTKNHALTRKRPTIVCCNMHEMIHSPAGTLPTTNKNLPTHSHRNREKVQNHPLEGTLPPAHGHKTCEDEKAKNHLLEGTLPQVKNHPLEGTLPQVKNHPLEGTLPQVKNHPLEGTLPQVKNHPLEGTLPQVKNHPLEGTLPQVKNHPLEGTLPQVKNHPLEGTLPPVHGHKTHEDEKVKNHPLDGTLPRTHGHNTYEGEKVKNHLLRGTLPPIHGYNTYEGSWRRGQRHGAGLLHNATGMTFRGTWVKNKKQGPGVLRAANGVVVHVVCVDDVMYLRPEESGEVAESVRTKSNAPQ